MNDFKVLLQAVLDASNIGRDDIDKVQKVIDKYHLNLTADLDKATMLAEIKKIVPQLEAELKKMTGIDIKISDTAILKSINQLDKELDRVTSKSHKIQLQLDNGTYKRQLAQVIADSNRWKNENGEVKASIAEVQSAYNNLTDAKQVDNRVANEEKFLQALKKSQNAIAVQKTQFATDDEMSSLLKKYEDFYSKNTAAHGRWGKDLQDGITKLSSGMQLSQKEADELRARLQRIGIEARNAGKLGYSAFDKLKNAWQKFGGWSLATGSLMAGVNQIKDAVSELKELDSILTEISKTSDLTEQQLKKLGEVSFDAASKYGRTASDYLTAIQEMSRSGFYGEQGQAMAEQSLLAQSAGDLTDDVANNYILATNAAYKLNGEAEKLNAVLDGQNSITNKNSVAMSDMATAMSESGTTASAYRVSIEDLSAMIGTIESVTKLGGSEVGNAIKAILINLQNVTSSKIVDTLDSANASMTEMIDGAEKLRNPIDILKDLAKTFNELDEDDPLRAEILTNIGQKYHATKLAALLQNVDMFDKQLGDYASGSGSAMEEATKSANNWEGSLNRLLNSWVEFIDKLTNQDALVDGINLLSGFVNGVTDLTGKIGVLSSAFGNINGAGGILGMLSGLAMNKFGAGERTKFQW